MANTTRKLPILGALLLFGACAQDPGLLEDTELDDGATTTAETSTDLAFEGADLQCFDGTTEIGLYATGAGISETGNGLGDIILNPGNQIHIRTGGEIHVINQNVLVSTDGAGNDRYQVLDQGGSGFSIAIDLYYDHEQGFLDGYYALPEYRTLPWGETYFEGLSDHLEIFGEALNCYDYTYGDL